MTEKANFISCGTYHPEPKESPIPMTFRKAFETDKQCVKATLRATAIGIFDIELNGKRVTEEYFAPGFTSYEHTLQYMEYDVTDKIAADNDLIVVVGAGWACGRFTYLSKTQITAKRQALRLSLKLEYADGASEIYSTDESWQVSMDGPYRFADFYDGETLDARIEYDKMTWQPAMIEHINIRPQIVKRTGVPVIRHEKMMPARSFVTPSGKLAYDFGQNFAGVVDLKINGHEGQTITVRHAEVLAHGELCFSSLRTAKATATYICKEGQQSYSPRLTYMGFRYIQIDGIDAADVEVAAYAIYSDIQKIAAFECSNEDLNRVQSNIEWGARSNFVEVPTDCPQRDERLGWTGDLSVFCSTACYNYDMKEFLNKWLRDVRSEQKKSGGVPFIVPKHGTNYPDVPTACWGDSCIIVPWTSYMSSGDIDVLKDNYPMMKKYLNAVKHSAALFSFGDKRYIWKLLFQFGDWCAPEGGVQDWLKRGPWVGTAFYSYDCLLMSKVATELGLGEDASEYLALKAKVDSTYMSQFTDGNGKLTDEFQTGYILPIYFRMADDETLHKMADNLERMVIDTDYHLCTGFMGTPFILFALCDMGKVDTAYKVLLQDTAPSWLYEIKRGATTFWEGWRTVPPDNIEQGLGLEESEGGESFNHYAAGSVGDFLYRRVAGLEATSAGYKTFKVVPVPGGGLTHVKTSHESPYGRIAVEWRIDADAFAIDIDVPTGTTCSLTLPDGSESVCKEGHYTHSCTL